MSEDIVTLGLGVDSTQVKEAKKSLDQLSDAGGRAEKSTRIFGESSKSSNAAAEQFTASLKRQADTIGMTTGQVRSYDAVQLKLNDAQRASVDASNRAIESYEKQQAVLSNLKTMAIGAGAALGVALVAGLKTSITMAAEAEQSHLRLAAVLRGTGHAAGLTKGDLDAMADGMKEKLGIDDDALRDSMAVLLTFRNVSKDSFGEALETSANLAAVMQTDLKSAVLQLGKALENPEEGLTALRRSGISFTETQKDMINGMVAAGNQAEAITFILKTMKEQGLDGVAEAMNSGVTKAIRDTGLAWDDFMKALGNTSTVKSVTEGFFNGLSGSLKDLRQSVESGDWLDRLTLFATGIKTPSLIAKINESAAISSKDDDQARAIADEGLARQKANQEAELAAIARKKAEEEEAKAREEASKRAIAAARAREEAEKHAYQQSIDGSNRVIAALKTETEQIGLNVVQKKMMSAAAEAAKAPTKELAQQIMASAQAWAQATQQQEALVDAEKERVSAINAIEKAEKEAAKAAEASARESAQQWNSMWGSVEQTAKTSFIQFAAHGTSAMKSIGEAIKLSIIDVLYQLTVRKWMINIGASLEGAFTSSALGSAAGSAAGGTSLLSNVGSGAGIMSLLKGGASGISSSISGMMSGGGIGAFALPAIGAFALNSMSNAFAGDKTLGNGFTDFMQKIPILGAGWDILAGLFGHGPMKFRQQSIQGTASSDGFDGDISNVFRAKGGFFVGNKHRTQIEEFSKEQQNIFDTAIKGFYTSAHGFAENLGFSTDLVDTFTKEVQIKSEKGKTVTEEAIAEMIAGIGDSLAKNVLPTVDEFKKIGETTIQTLSRLSGEFSVLTNATQLLFNKTSEQAKAFVRSFSMTDTTAFVDKAGGADALAQKAAGFAQKFYTEAQVMKPIIANLVAARDDPKIGLSGINTRQQAADAMLSGNLNPEQVLFLFNNQDAIDRVFTYLDKFNSAVKETGEAANNAVVALSVRNADETEYGQRLNKGIADASAEIEKLEGIAKNLRGTVNSINPISIGQARSQITNGGLDASNLSDSLSALSGMGTAGFSNVLDFKRAKGANVAAINALQNMADSDIMSSTKRLNSLYAEKENFQTALIAATTAMTIALNQTNRRFDKWDNVGMPPERAA